MSEFLQHGINCWMAIVGDINERSTQLVMQLRRNTNRVPVEFTVSSSQSLTLRFRKINALLNCMKSIDQKRVSFLSREQHGGIQLRLTSFIARKRRSNFVPMRAVDTCDEIRLPEVLTFINCFLDSSHRSRTCEFGLWRRPRQTARLRAAIRLPGCTFPTLGLFMPSRPQFSGCTRQLFCYPEKSLRDEVDDGH